MLPSISLHLPCVHNFITTFELLAVFLCSLSQAPRDHVLELCLLVVLGQGGEEGASDVGFDGRFAIWDLLIELDGED